MPVFEIKEAKLQHCGQMIRMLRVEHYRAVAQLGINGHQELRNRFDASAFRRIWTIDGRLSALGGVTGSLLDATGYVWLAMSWEAARYPIQIVREARKQLGEILGYKNRLSTRIISTDPASLRFARSLGFYVSHPLPFGAEDSIVQMEICKVRQRRERVRADTPFIVYTAGRSRTAWLSSFLTYGDLRCHNEAAIKFKQMDEVRQFFADNRTGSAETAAAPGWRLVNHCAPGIRTVVVQRDEEDIIDSFARMEIAKIAMVDEDRLRKVVAYESRCLREISEQPGVLTVKFEDLERPSVCKDVFEHCLPYAFDFEWWEEISRRNIQSDVLSLTKYYQDNMDDVENFKRDSKRQLIHLVRAGEIGKQHAIN